MKKIISMKQISVMTFAVLIMFATVFASSCSGPAGESGEGKSADAAGSEKIIGVSLLKENDDFYVTMKKGMIDTAKEMGYKIEVLSADNDEMKQDRNVDSLLLKNISALVICPVNSKGVGTIIKKATDKGIPVFTADIAAEKGKVVAHIASDNYLGGKIAGEEMVKLLGGEGKVAIVEVPGAESVYSRVKGFVDAAKAGGLTVLEPALNGKDDTQESERAANSIILSNADLKGIFAANDNMAIGVETAIIASGKDIALIGYNASPAAQEKIKAGGPWKSDVIQYPSEIGKVTIETIDKFVKGELEKKDETIVIPVKVGMWPE